MPGLVILALAPRRNLATVEEEPEDSLAGEGSLFHLLPSW